MPSNSSNTNDGEVSLTLYDLESGLHEAILQAMEAQDELARMEHGLDIAREAKDRAKIKEYATLAAQAQRAFNDSQAIIRAYLESATQKRDRVARFLIHLDSQAALASDEIRRLQDRKRTLDNASQSLKSHVIHIMQTMGVRKLEGETSTLSLRKAPGRVEVTALDKLPPEFKKTEVVVTPMKKEIGAALKAGDEVEGASWIDGGDYLMVK